MSKAVPIISGAVLGFFQGGPVGAIAGAVAGAAQVKANSKREKAAKKALAEQKKQTAISNAQQEIQRGRAIRQSIADARVRQAQIEAAAFAGGPAGVGQAILGDTGGAIGASNTQAGAANAIGLSQNRQASFINESRSSNSFDTIAGVANLVGGVAGANKQGAFSGIGNFFGGGSGTSVGTSNASTFSDFGGAVSGGR